MGSALREVVLWPKIVVNIKDESLERLAGASAGVTSTRRNHCYRDIASLCQIHPLFQPHSVLEIFKKKIIIIIYTEQSCNSTQECFTSLKGLTDLFSFHSADV